MIGEESENAVKEVFQLVRVGAAVLIMDRVVLLRSEKVKLEFNPYQFNRRFMALFVVP